MFRRDAAIALLAGLALAGCSDSPTDLAPVATALRINPSSVSLSIGGTEQLSAVALDQQGQPMDALPAGTQLAWSSADTTVATIDEAGLLRGRRPGSITVSARAGTIEGSVQATVLSPQIGVEDARLVSAPIGMDGGVIETESSAGVRYRLEIPRSALTEETTISLTPVAGIGNAPFVNLLGAVRFAPDGLRLLTPARLIIELPSVPDAPADIGGILFADDGGTLDRWPIAIVGRTATVVVRHFSGAGVAETEDPDAFAPREPFDVMWTLTNEIIELDGEYNRTGEANLPARIDIYREWYAEVVEPALRDAATPDEVEEAIIAWRLWLTMLINVGFGAEIVEALGPEIDEARELAAEMLRFAIELVNKNCIAEQNWIWFLNEALPLQRMAEDFDLAGPESGLDAEAVLAGVCFQVHNVDILFPEHIIPGEPAELIVRTGIGYGGADAVVSDYGAILTRITPSGSTDDSPYEELSVEVIRQIVPKVDHNLFIHIRSCFAIDQWSGYSVQLSEVCAEDTIERIQCRVHTGDVTLAAQADVEELAGVCEIRGSLTISELDGTSDPIVSLAPLSDLERLVRRDNNNLHLMVGPTTGLANLTGLERLTMDPGWLTIAGNAGMTSLSGLGTHAERETAGMLQVLIQNNPALSDISAIASFLRAEGGVTISNFAISASPALQTLAGLETIRRVATLGLVGIPIGSLEGLGVDEVWNSLAIDSTDLPELVLSEFLTVGPPIINIRRNPSLTSVNLTGDSLRIVNIAENGALETISIDYSLGIPNLNIGDEPALTTLDLKLGSRTAQRVSLLRTGLQSIGGSNLTAIQPRPSETGEGLFIQENPNLTDIGAFQAITAYNRFLVIRDNPQLCVPQGFHDVPVTQSRTIVNNESCEVAEQ